MRLLLQIAKGIQIKVESNINIGDGDVYNIRQLLQSVFCKEKPVFTERINFQSVNNSLFVSACNVSVKQYTISYSGSVTTLYVIKMIKRNTL